MKTGKENFYPSFLGCQGKKHHGLEHLMLFQSMSVCAQVCVRMKGKNKKKSNSKQPSKKERQRKKERRKERKKQKKSIEHRDF